MTVLGLHELLAMTLLVLDEILAMKMWAHIFPLSLQAKEV